MAVLNALDREASEVWAETHAEADRIRAVLIAEAEAEALRLAVSGLGADLEEIFTEPIFAEPFAVTDAELEAVRLASLRIFRMDGYPAWVVELERERRRVMVLGSGWLPGRLGPRPWMGKTPMSFAKAIAIADNHLPGACNVVRALLPACYDGVVLEAEGHRVEVDAAGRCRVTIMEVENGD